MTFSPDSRIETLTDVLSQEVGGEMVLLDLNSEQYFGLDAVGARIWALLSHVSNPAGLVDTLLQEYPVERERLEEDVARFLAQLADAGLIRYTSEGRE